jgi:hypothetical protein
VRVCVFVGDGAWGGEPLARGASQRPARQATRTSRALQTTVPPPSDMCDSIPPHDRIRCFLIHLFHPLRSISCHWQSVNERHQFVLVLSRLRLVRLPSSGGRILRSKERRGGERRSDRDAAHSSSSMQSERQSTTDRHEGVQQGNAWHWRCGSLQLTCHPSLPIAVSTQKAGRADRIGMADEGIVAGPRCGQCSRILPPYRQQTGSSRMHTHVCSA